MIKVFIRVFEHESYGNVCAGVKSEGNECMLMVCLDTLGSNENLDLK